MKHIHLSELMPVAVYTEDPHRLIQWYVYASTLYSVKETIYVSNIVALVIYQYNINELSTYMCMELQQARTLFSEYLVQEYVTHI